MPTPPKRPAQDPVRYENVTEAAGVPVSSEGASMIATRYEWAARLTPGCRVLEIGCGAGVGLGRLAAGARYTCGIDVSAALLRSARAHYGGRVSLVRSSADDLPFAAASFDVVVFFESTYYVADTERAFRETARVLTPGGVALFASANPERPDFVRSPHSVSYHSADQFRAALEALGFRVTVEGAFPVEIGEAGLGHRLGGAALRLARRTLERLRLVPRTLRGRAWLKRLVHGKLTPVPAELLTGFAGEAARHVVAAGPARGFKVLYVTAKQRGAAGLNGHAAAGSNQRHSLTDEVE
jgi:SAM-dependent methyltransferase